MSQSLLYDLGYGYETKIFPYNEKSLVVFTRLNCISMDILECQYILQSLLMIRGALTL